MKLGNRKFPHHQQGIERRQKSVAEIYMRIGDPSRNVGIGREVPNRTALASVKCRADRRAKFGQIRAIDLRESAAPRGERGIEVSSIAQREIIERDDIVSAQQQRGYQMAPDKAGCAGDQVNHAVRRSIFTL